MSKVLLVDDDELLLRSLQRSLTAKGFEVHSPSTVTVTGTARDNASLLRTLDLLRQSKEVQGLKIEQIRGKTPAQFTFTFRWVGTPGS